MAKLYLKRSLSGFIPADEASSELMRKYKVGEAYRAEMVRPRDGVAHRRYWALINIVLQNTEQFKSAELLHQYLKIRAGHCTPVVNKSTGEVYLIPASISYSTLDEVEFQKVWRAVVDVVCEEIIPGITEAEIEYEIQKVCGLAA